uniref:Putative secreted protein n=1 Tax=Ixodes ricinus TaxID=34613 RepID=A0A6B0U1Q5_IXORI
MPRTTATLIFFAGTSTTSRQDSDGRQCDGSTTLLSGNRGRFRSGLSIPGSSVPCPAGLAAAGGRGASAGPSGGRSWRPDT